jgi:penicillin-binding protein 2
LARRLAPKGPRSRIPRFLPPDPRVSQPYLLTPKMALRVAIVGAVALVAFGILFLRLWSLQVLAATKYRGEAQNNQVRTISLDAPRGPILDSQGRVLVENTVSNAVIVWPADLPKGRALDGELGQLGKVLGTTRNHIKAVLRAHRNDGPPATTPVTLQVGIRTVQADYIYEHASRFNGVEIRPTYLRYYNSEGLLAQTLGYVGRIDAVEYKSLKHSPVGYQQDDRIGQAGVESSYDQYLHGRHGTAQVTVDSTGRPTGPLKPAAKATPGDAVRLTIDIRLQRAAEQALDYGIKVAQGTKDGWAADGGAIVAMDPNTGAILALASSPTYKPRVWVSRTANGLKPLQDPKAAARANYPILNRALDVTYPPGSTWKPITALAALEENVVSPSEPLLCSGSYTVKTIYGAPQTFTNWNPFVSQYMTMPTALTQSCDTYFYQLGWDFYNLPANRGQPLQNWAEQRFGFGKFTGVDIGPEANGLVPTIAWRHKTFTRKTDPKNWQIDRLWKPGDSIQLAIGQKDIAVTPLQLARFYALLANGGKLVTPYVVQDVEAPSSGGKGAPTVLQSFQPPAPQPVGLNPDYLQVVRDGLYQATHDPNGTSSSTFAAFPVPIAGKTGTAQKVVTLPGSKTSQVLNQSLWCGWGPNVSAKIVICVVIENGGHGGTAAAPAAAQVLAKFFNVKAQATGKVSD